MTVDMEQIARQFAAAPSLVPFDARTLAFTHALSRALSSDLALRREGAVQALAFWLRPAETRRLETHLRTVEGSESILVPRGTVFHVPPSNVDTLFVYSWILSLLMGNRNVVRLSQRLSGIGARVASVVEDVLQEDAHADVAAGAVFVRYGHDDALTTALSGLCDVRVLWGGDAAVSSLRALPLPAHATELVFPDRYSASVLNAQAVEALDDAGRDALADRFANDAFWFDQNACASPRLVAWIGSAEAADRVRDDFWQRVVAAAARRGVFSEAGTVLAKMTEAARAAIDEGATQILTVSPEVTVVRLSALDALRRVAPGGGLFHDVVLPSLEALGPHLARRDQTLTVFGLTREDIMQAARVFNGRGIDRFVPVGQALAFHHVWDGYDLFQQFTRRVHIAPQGW
ncbi:MAG TPA: acyl-CoA reductase [Gemmatimonas sp.]|uniref:acyl-CoA reductase n=1 Tax=Gemmatimonas sp. TaxID=1962908 RepID=UPI002ED8723B